MTGRRLQDRLDDGTAEQMGGHKSQNGGGLLPLRRAAMFHGLLHSLQMFDSRSTSFALDVRQRPGSLHIEETEVQGHGSFARGSVRL